MLIHQKKNRRIPFVLQNAIKKVKIKKKANHFITAYSI
jgi:hypothetical protein